RSPSSDARRSSFEGSRAKESITSCPPLTAWRAQLPPMRPAPITPIFISNPQRLDHRLGDLATRILLLAGDQPSVAGDERLEASAMHVVAATPREHILDPPWHHFLADKRVAELLLDVREAGHGLVLDKV